MRSSVYLQLPHTRYKMNLASNLLTSITNSPLASTRFPARKRFLGGRVFASMLDHPKVMDSFLLSIADRLDKSPFSCLVYMGVSAGAPTVKAYPLKLPETDQKGAFSIKSRLGDSFLFQIFVASTELFNITTSPHPLDPHAKFIEGDVCLKDIDSALGFTQTDSCARCPYAVLCENYFPSPAHVTDASFRQDTTASAPFFSSLQSVDAVDVDARLFRDWIRAPPSAQETLFGLGSSPSSSSDSSSHAQANNTHCPSSNMHSSAALGAIHGSMNDAYYYDEAVREEGERAVAAASTVPPPSSFLCTLRPNSFGAGAGEQKGRRQMFLVAFKSFIDNRTETYLIERPLGSCKLIEAMPPPTLKPVRAVMGPHLADVMRRELFEKLMP